MLKETIEDAKSKFTEILEEFTRDIQKFRTGRASISILDSVTAEYYGTQTPINQMATLSIPEANLIVIQPWDPKVIGEIEKAIRTSNLDVNPISDGKLIRIPIPPLDEQRRLEIIKTLKRHTEERKTTIRNTRRDFREIVKHMKDDKEISEDEEKRFYDDLQKVVDEYIDKLDDIEKNKERHILED